MAFATPGSSQIISAFGGSPGPRPCRRGSGTTATAARAGSRRSSGRSARRARSASAIRPAGKPASRNTSGSSQMSPIQMPADSASERAEALEQRARRTTSAPTAIISAPVRFSGRRSQPAMPLAMNAQPTTRNSSDSSPNSSWPIDHDDRDDADRRPRRRSARGAASRDASRGREVQRGCGGQRGRGATITRGRVRVCPRRCKSFNTSTWRTWPSGARRTARRTSR